MALIIFKYFLPILLGYTLFVGISSRYIPFIRPRTLTRRPSWFLGLWTGVAVAIIMSVGLQIAYKMNLNDVSNLFAPGAWLLAAAMLPGLIGYLWYRYKVSKVLKTRTDGRMTDALYQAEAEELRADDLDSAVELDNTLQLEIDSENDQTQTTIIWNDADMTSAFSSEMDETALLDVEVPESAEPHFVSEDVVSEDVKIETAAETSDADADVEHIEETDVLDATLAVHDSKSMALETAQTTNALMEVNRLRYELDSEISLRKELESHLRITRRGLSELESESRNFEIEKATALTELERELEDRVKRTAAAEARAEREAEKCAAMENDMVLLRQDALKASNESRTSMEARAQALSTANKASTFARQAMQVRTRLETQLSEAEAELDSKQSTISSLIKALEKEKARTNVEVSAMAKQLVLHEKQLQARRSLEEVSRSSDSKLTNRLVKKVAKARGQA